MSQTMPYPIKEIKLDVWTKKVNSTSMFTIPAEDEALPVLREFQEIMTRLLTLPIHETLDESCIEFFFVNVCPVVCQKLIRSRYFKSQVVLKLANSFLQNSVYLVQKYLDIGIKYPKFLEVLPIVLCTDQYYFKSNDQLSFYHYPYSYFPNRDKIGETLKVGDLVDVLKIDNVFDKATWSQGKVTDIIGNYELQIAYLYDWTDKLTRLRLQSPQIAPYQSKSKDSFEWRFQIKKGDVIDCEDTYGNWYNATITDIIEGKDHKRKVKYIFRVYHPKGTRTDQDNRTYFGTLLDQEMEVDVTSPKIAKFCTIAKQYSYESSKTAYDTVQDINDYEFSEMNGEKVYALPRKKYLSSLLFETINGFGRAGGFQKILEYLEQEINYDVFCYFSKGINGIAPFLNRKFIQQIIGRLRNLVYKYIFSDPEKMTKQFTKQKSSMIFAGIRALQKRICSTDSVYKFQNQIKMKLVESCLDDKLTQKLQGLNELKDIVKNGSYVTEKNRQIKNWIKENNIFEKIYIVNSHAQLIKKSEDFFKYLISEAILEVNDLQRLYKIAQKSDFETRISLYKLFQEVAYLFKKNHVEFLIDTILESDLSLVRNQDIDLLHELSRFSNYFPLDKVINFFENIILSENVGQNKSSELNDYAIKKYSDIVVRNPEIKPRRRTIIKNFLSKMSTHDISQITKVLKGIFQGIGIGEWGKRDLYEILADQKVDEVCIEALTQVFKNSPENFQYNFKQILTFLLNIFKLSYKIKINASTLSSIWNIICDLEQEYHKIYFKWMTELFDKCEQGIQCDSMEQFQGFYRKIYTEERIKKMLGLEFEVAKNLFTEINKKTKLISVSTCLRNNVTEKQYKRKVEIRSLKLIDILFQMIFKIESEDISEKVLSFFVELYNSKENSQNQIQCFLAELLIDFKQYFTEKQFKQINKIIKLFEVVINDSEKINDANIESLRKKKNKKEKIKFMIINEIYYASDTVKKVDMFLEMSMTVKDLRKRLAKEFDANWQEIRITGSRQIPDHQNSKTLEEIKLNPNTPLTITKRIVYYTEQDSDLIIGNELNPKAIRCFKKIFQRYSTNGFMNKDQCNSFTAMCLGSSSSKKHYVEKINTLYAKYDDDNDELLTVDNFLTFYKDASDDRPVTVWSNLRSFGVRGNFRFKDEPEQEINGVERFPRVILSESDEFYKILFELLKVKECASLAYELLERLPVYKDIENKVLSIEKQEDINQLFHSEGQYELYYKLNIIEYLVNSKQLKSDEQLQFHSKFIRYHGYQELYNLSKKSVISVISEKKLAVETDELTFYEDNNRIDINEYLLYTILSLLQSFWLNGSIFNQEKQKKTIKESMALLTSDFEMDEKIEYLVTGAFPKKEQKLVITEGDFNNSKDLDEYKWNGETVQEVSRNMLKRTQEMWISYKKTLEILNSTNNPTTKQNISTIIYILSSLISKTLQIVNILFVNREELSAQLIKKLLSLIEQSHLPKLSVQVYCLILCQCFYSDSSESNQSIQSTYIQELFKSLTKGNMVSSEHFLVLAVLVSKFGIAGGQQQKEEVEKMKQILFDNVLNNNNQSTIEGCAQLLCNFKLINISFEKFQKIWENRLFNPKSIITKQQTKAMLYDLILKICDYNPNLLNPIIKRIQSTIATESPKMKITYCNQFKQRSVTNYAGLKNLGNICYMNSMLQQIYMNKIFRYLILRINDKKEHTETEIFDEKEQTMRLVDDNLLHQTQRIFAFLNKTTRIDFSPKDFCVAYKPFGEPVNIMIQQDVQQFVSMFFDRLQSFLNETPFKNIVQEFYSGKTCNIFKCHNCKKSRKVEENFHCLTLQIKNAKNLGQSFVRFTTGEQINDFRCDFCEKKVDVEKKTVISKAPKILLIHLQRIIFNLDTFVNEKLSTKHSFPNNFNLFPYTLQSIEKQALKAGKKDEEEEKGIDSKEEPQNSQEEPDSRSEKEKSSSKPTIEKENTHSEEENYEYDLAGIVCHSGHAEAGHYISYIKSSENKWLQFNDSLVTYFNPANIESECFGGVFATTSTYDDEYDWDTKRETCKCAYMVIYERKNIKEEDSLLRLVLNDQTSKQEFLKEYDLSEVILKLKENEEKVSTDKDGRQMVKKVRDEESGFDTGDNITNEVNPTTESQEDSSDIHQDSERETKELLEAKQLEIKRHLSEDNIQTDKMELIKEEEKEKVNEEKQILINLNNLTAYEPTSLLEEVDSDNTIHFIEKSLSSSNFSKFFAQLLSRPHSLQEQMLPICQKLTFGFWLKSPSFKELLIMLDTMIRGSPEGFQDVITENKNMINLLIQCPDSEVRTNMAAFLSRAIIDVVNGRPDIDILDENEPIVKFLDHLLSLLPTMVTKCWTKFSQYFEFWYELTQKDSKIIRYLLNREVIKHFMDYFMDTKSPLKIYCHKKANQIGSSYASPNFSFLLKCISVLLQIKLANHRVALLQNLQIEGSVPYDYMNKLSSDEQILLISCESLEKLISDNYEFIATELVKNICPNNLYASEKVAFVILKGINKATYETIQPYLEVLHEYALIEDQYQELRIKWVLGKQTLAISTYAKKLQAVNAYTLDQRLYNYDSALFFESSASLLDYLFIYYKKMQNFSMLCLRKLLRLCELSKYIRDYVWSLESPTLALSKYVDFFKDFINRVCGYTGYFSVSFNKEQLGKELKALYLKVMQIVENEQKQNEPEEEKVQTEQKQEKEDKIQKNDKQEEEENKEIQKEIEKEVKNIQETVIKSNDVEVSEQIPDEFTEYSAANACNISQPINTLDQKKQSLQQKKDQKEEIRDDSDEENLSFKGEKNNSSNERDRNSSNSWDEQYPDLNNMHSNESDNNAAPAGQSIYPQNQDKKKEYEINVIYTEEEKNKHGPLEEVTSMEFTSEEDEPLINKYKQNSPTKSSQEKDYKLTYHPILFDYIPIKEVVPTQIKEEDLYQNIYKDIKITYHESIVTYALTKPTGTTNRSLQMGMSGQKIIDRFSPDIMENIRKQTVAGFYVKNETRDWIRIETDDGCTYCKGMDSAWAWCKQIKRVWPSQKSMDFPKWSLFKIGEQK